MISEISSLLCELRNELKVLDKFEVACTLLPVLLEQSKPMEKRAKVKLKKLLSTNHEFGVKNFEGDDILRNAIKLRLADYMAGVSIKEVVLVCEGWMLFELVLRDISGKEFFVRLDGLILYNLVDYVRAFYGTSYVDIDKREVLEMFYALDKGLYYRNEEAGILIRDDGSVFFFVTDEDRCYVKDRVRLYSFLRCASYE